MAPQITASASERPSDLVPLLEILDHVQQMANFLSPLLLEPTMLMTLAHWIREGRPADFLSSPPFEPDPEAFTEILQLVEQVTDHCAAAIVAALDFEEAVSSQLTAN